MWASRKEKGARFLLAWIIPGWIVFELVMTKLPHYVLPAYPAIAILIAGVVNRHVLARERWLTQHQRTPFGAELPAERLVLTAGALLFGLLQGQLGFGVCQLSLGILQCQLQVGLVDVSHRCSLLDHTAGQYAFGKTFQLPGHAAGQQRRLFRFDTTKATQGRRL